MKGFTEVQSVFCIILERGVFRQVPVFDDGSIIYAKAKGGYIRLMDGFRTSVPSVSWRLIDGAKVKATNTQGVNGLKVVKK